jgi:hypothetical protein
MNDESMSQRQRKLLNDVLPFLKIIKIKLQFIVKLILIILGVPLATEPGISLMSCLQRFLEKSGGRHPPSKSSIWALSKKLETKGTLLDEHTGGGPKMNAGFGSEWDTLSLAGLIMIPNLLSKFQISLFIFQSVMTHTDRHRQTHIRTHTHIFCYCTDI